jgi:epsilon-lactone hydrolase
MTPSLTARLVGFALRTTGIYRSMFSGGAAFETSLAKIRAAGDAKPAEKLKKRANFDRKEFEGRAVWHVTPKDKPATTTVLFYHGGGYVYPPMDTHWDFFATMAATHGWHVIAPLYPLAPEAGAVETTAFALSVYKNVIASHDPAMLTVAGDSAGAGLAAATMQAARDVGIALAARMILVSPWLEANPAHPDQLRIEPRDAILTINGIAEAGQLYARDLPLTDPRVSPIHADWAGLPPTLVYGAGDDILVTDARALKAKLPSIDYIELAGMVHDWPLFFFSESRKAQAQMAAFAKG